jgi:hypothetical protein
MDGEGLKIFGSPIERYYSNKEYSNRVGFLGMILDKIFDRTRFSFGHRSALDRRT